MLKKFLSIVNNNLFVMYDKHAAVVTHTLVGESTAIV